jgi:BirA family biotin operon repressor/biotin-[acetyl-CoA-carboxylase] ligase
MKKRFIYLEQTDSTNRFLREMPSQGEDMTIVRAGFQTAGRGQGSNTWESDAGENLLMSIRIHPVGVLPTRQFVLSEVGALAVAEALDAYVGHIALKWPNDIYWKNFKISGTLIETALSGGGMKECMYGIGINVNQRVFRSDAPNPISLAQILGRNIEVQEVMTRVVDSLESILAALGDGGLEKIRQTYHERLYRKEGFHPYCDEGGTFMAEIKGVEDDGHLLLQDTDGKVRKYAFKEVQFIL